MYRKNYLTGFLTIALFLIGGLSALAQTSPISGQVVLKDAEGKTTPVAGALIEVYRVDIKQRAGNDTTDKKGNFSFAGLQIGAIYVLSVSGPGIGPEIVPNVKAGNDKLTITVSAGDGKKWTEEEVRSAANQKSSSSSSSEMTAEQKKQKEEYDKQVADVTAKNEKIKNQTAAVQKALEEGNAAFNSKNYDVAVAKYDEGFQANPDFVGSAPVLLNNKGTALKARAVQVYNDNVKSTDANTKAAALAKVRQDLANAADAFNKSWNLIKNAPAADINDPKTNEINKMNALSGAKDAFRLMAVTEQADAAQAEIAKALIAEYIAVEPDTTKKAEAQRILGDVYRVANDFDNAVIEYKKVLEIDPTNPDALAGVGLSLVNQGYLSDDKAKFQEGADYLQKYIDSAPPNHKYVADAKGLIETLKQEQKVTPTKGKTTTTVKKKN